MRLKRANKRNVEKESELVFTVESVFEIGQSMGKCCARATNVEAETVAVGVAAERGAVVERKTGYVLHTAKGFLVGESIIGEVEPHKERGLGDDCFHTGHIGSKELACVGSVAFKILQQLVEPFLAMSECRLGTDEGKDVAACNAIVVEIGMETGTEVRIMGV